MANQFLGLKKKQCALPYPLVFKRAQNFLKKAPKGELKFFIAKFTELSRKRSLKMFRFCEKRPHHILGNKI